MSNEMENVRGNANRIMLKSKFAYAVHEIYLDWFNNFLTLSCFAEYYGISEEFATALIKEAKRLEREL